MRRREFFVVAMGAVLWSSNLTAQQPATRKRRVGILMPYAENDAEHRGRVQILRQTLAQLGWSEESNIQYDERWSTDNMDRIRADAVSLLASSPDVVVSIGDRVVPVLMKASSSIPIVVPGASDPVGTGWVQSLARPGGNVTGFTLLELSLLGKMLEILKEIAPAIRRVAIVYNPDNPNTVFFRQAFQESTAKLEIEAITIPVHGVTEIDTALAGLVIGGSGQTGIFLPPDVTLQALRTKLVNLINQRGLPAIYPAAVYVRSGGLVSYGVDALDLWRRASEYVDRILRGEKPADLPFQNPTKYQLTINARTAKALALAVPPILLARADELIE